MCSHDAPQASVILRRSSPRIQHARFHHSCLPAQTHADILPSLLHPLFRSPSRPEPAHLTFRSPNCSPLVPPQIQHTTAALQPSPVWAAPMGPAAVAAGVHAVARDGVAGGPPVGQPTWIGPDVVAAVTASAAAAVVVA